MIIMIDYQYKNLFLDNSMPKQVKISCGNAVLTNEDLYNQEMTLEESLCSEKELRFGCCESSILKFRISDIFSPMFNKWLDVKMIINGHSDAPFSIGRYKVDSDKPTSDKRYRNIVAYDAMHDIISSSAIKWYNTILPSKDSKVTMKQFRTSFVEYFGLQQQEITLANDDMIVEKTIQVEEGVEIDNDTDQVSILKESALSGLDVITAICEINGCFGHIGRDGKFHYIYLQPNIQGLYPSNNLFPDNAPDYLPQQQRKGHLYPQEPKNTKIEKDKYIECHYENFVTKTIDKLQIRQEKNDIGVVWPEGDIDAEDNCYIIESNFLVYGKSSEDLQVIAQNIYEKIHNVVYRPFDADVIGNPCLEVGDPVGFSTRFEIVESYVLQRTLKGIQALRDNFKSDGEEKREEKVNGVNSSILQLKGKTNTIERRVEKNELKINDVETGLSSRITQLIDSISMSVSNEDKEASVILHIVDGDTEYDIVSDKIDFTGLVSFSNLSTQGETTINGGNITTGTIQSINIRNGNLIEGKYPFSVDENGNMFANNATIWGDLYGLNNLKLYNNIRGEHRTVIVLENGDSPDSSRFVFKKPVTGNFLIVDEQEGVHFTEEIRVDSLRTYGNIRLRGSEQNGVTRNGPDNSNHYILDYNASDRSTGVGMKAFSEDGQDTTTTLKGNTVKLQSAGSVTTSDERLKNSFKPLDEFDAVYMDIPTCAFKYNDGTSGRFHFGAKAQDVKEAFEKHGYTTQDFGGFVQMEDNPKNKDYCGVDDPMGLIYTEFTMWNMHMIQNLCKENKVLKERLSKLEERIESHEQSI